MATTQITLGYPTTTNLFQETAIGNAALTVKNAGGTIFTVEIDNTANASIVYLKLYNTNGAVVVGTTAPDDVILAPASLKFDTFIIGGKAFASGLQVACVTTGGTAGVTA